MAETHPIVLLIRRRGHWQEWGAYSTAEEAARDHRKRISGRGVTAWSWWGPRDIAAKMLADPSYDPDAAIALASTPPKETPDHE